MDPKHFDTLVRTLAPTTSRRGLLATALGELLVALPARPDETVTAGKKTQSKRGQRGGKRPGHAPKHPEPRRSCSGGACAAQFTTRADRDWCEFICRQCDGKDPRDFCISSVFPGERVAVCCVEGAECCGGHGGVCCGGDAKDPGRRCCDGDCVDTDRDPSNCGRCNRRCSGSQTCLDGECVADPNENIAECEAGFMHPICTKHPEFGACYPVDAPHICCGGEAFAADPVTVDCCVGDFGAYAIAKTRDCPDGVHLPPEAVYMP